MPATSIRVVLDTNVLLRGLLNARSAAGRVLNFIEHRRVTMLLSKPLLSEYHAVLSDPAVIGRFPELTHERVKLSLQRLRYHCEFLRDIKNRFGLQRDPRDEKLIELAIAGKATDIVSADADLLSLPTGYDDAAKRFRQRLPVVTVMRPDQFLTHHSTQLKID